jgi:hypothetical protein
MVNFLTKIILFIQIHSHQLQICHSIALFAYQPVKRLHKLNYSGSLFVLFIFNKYSLYFKNTKNFEIAYHYHLIKIAYQCCKHRYLDQSS